MTAAERMLREAEVRDRRRRVHRAEGLVVAVFVLGIAAIALARELAPALFDLFAMLFVLGTAVSLLGVWRTARRHWRCPVCDARWETSDTLASFFWNHCPVCGESLRVHAKQEDAERRAMTEFALEALSHDLLVVRFERRRRRCLVAAGFAALAGVLAILWVQSRGFGEWVEHGVVSLFIGLVVAAAVISARCPRCNIGVITGKGRYCQRCGLRLSPDADGAVTRSGNRAGNRART